MVELAPSPIIKFNRIYSKDNYNWTNELIVRYGLNKQDGIELRKTEDVLQFNSALGYRKTHSLTGTTPQNSISTQFTDGYAYPNTEVSISKRFAPYIFLGLGAEYATKTNKITLLISFTSKITMVLDQRPTKVLLVLKHCMMRKFNS
jgi:hypothetical protein